MVVSADKLIVCLSLALLGFGVSSNARSSGNSLMLTPSNGWLIHDATYLEQPYWWPDQLEWNGSGLNDDASYRYGASMIRYNGDNLHFWSCSEGDARLSIADYIRYRHSSNGGKTWSEDEIVLAPNVGSDDGWAVCDPNVVKFGNYYYLAYTGTDDSNNFGLNNHVFVARSENPNGPFVKWDGVGWSGQSPKAIIEYQGPSDRWGYGEPNMVVVDDRLYLYYTDGETSGKTRLALADANSTNWPNTLVDQGLVIPVRDHDEDQTDVKYVPEVGLFIATAIGSRFTERSYVHVWWSADGFSFQAVSNDNVNLNIRPTAHNLSMSGNELGHAQMGGHEFISYSYTGPDGRWGLWNSWLNPVSITGAGWVANEFGNRQSIFLNPIILLLLQEED